MRRFKNILAVVDNVETSRRALIAAAALADRNGARLTVVGLVEPTGANRTVALYDGTEVDIAGLIADERRGQIEDIVRGLDIPDVGIDVLVGVGFVEIVKRIHREAHDIVFCSPAEADGSGLAGSSLVMHLLRKSPVPVWVETPRGDPSADVAVAVGAFDEKNDLNTLLVDLAGSLAAIRHGTLHLIHAWELEGETMFRRGRVRQPSSYVDQLVDAARLEASANINRLAGRAEAFDVPHEVHLEKGTPGDVIPRTIAELRPGVVVLGTLARSGLRGMLIGNTAERVLGVVESSVLAAKPGDFVSPIPAD